MENKDRKVDYIPEEWMLIKLNELDSYKVFAIIRGQWRVNSGIEKVVEDDETYYFYGFSGSVYKCYKKRYGLRDPYSVKTFQQILRLGNSKLSTMKPDDWESIKKLIINT